MNRLQFNKTMVALGATSVLPAQARLPDEPEMPAIEYTESFHPIVLASVGGADGNTVAAIAQGLSYPIRTIAIDTDALALMSSGADCKVLICNGVHKSQQSRQAYEMGRRQGKKIEVAVGATDLLIVLAGMNGVAGTGLTPVLVELAGRRTIATICIAIMPSPRQGMNANPRVQQSIQQLQCAGADVFPIHSDGMAVAYGKGTQSVVKNVTQLCMLLSHNLHSIQTAPDSLRMALEGGSTGAIGFGSAARCWKYSKRNQKRNSAPPPGNGQVIERKPRHDKFKRANQRELPNIVATNMSKNFLKQFEKFRLS